MNFLKQLSLVIKRTGLILLGFSIIITFSEQVLTTRLEAALMSMDGAPAQIWIYGGLSLLISLITPVITSVLVIAALIKKNIFVSLSKHWQSVFIETLRAAGKSLSWSFLFIIPGLIRFLQFSFIPFIIMLDPDYDKGQKEALITSTKLVNKKFLQVSGLVVLFVILLPLLLTSLDEYAIFMSHPVSALALSTLETFISILFILSLLKQWEKTSGTHV